MIRLTWRDREEIALALVEKFPRIDPLSVRFTDLHRWVSELEGFADDPQRSSEAILEAIQMAWLEEHQERR
jgi:FeS assembly protein IscX